MKKKLSILFLTLPVVLALTTVLAVETNLINSINGFQKFAVENSRQAKIDDFQIKALESALEDAKHDADFQPVPGTKINMLNNGIKKEVAPLEAETNLEYAKRSKEENFEKLKLDIYKAALDKLLAQKQLETEASKLEILKGKYSMFEARYKEGKITENDLNDVKYTLDTKEIDRDKAEKNLEIADLELKRLLNVELDGEEVIVEDKLDLNEWRPINIEEMVERAIENNIEIYKKSENLKAREKTMEITEKYYKEGNFSYDDNKVNLETARIDLEDAKINFEVEVRNKYNNLLTAKDNLELATQWQRIQDKKLETAQAKYDQGLLSMEALLDQKEKCLDSEYQRFVAIHGFNILKAELEALCE
jgi:outer membrane protein TolC